MNHRYSSATFALIVLLAFTFAPGLMASAQQLEPDQHPSNAAPSARGGSAHVPPVFVGPRGSAASGRATATTPDTLITFKGSFSTTSGSAVLHFPFTMVGHAPSFAGTTTLNVDIIPVSLDLRNADNTPRFVNGKRLFFDVTPFIAQLLASPMFQKHTYSSSASSTQFVDAVQRAEFHSAPAAWHTVLKPIVRPTQVMTVLAGKYQFALKPDGTCCNWVTVDSATFNGKLFPSSPTDTFSLFGAAFHAGDFTTKDVITFFFPNTFLSNPGSSFFFVGFHTFVSMPGTPQNGNRERRFVMNYSSWVTPFVFFSDAFQDVTAVSHELTELFNDPFLGNITPWWKAPNGNCQNDLETGDVTEDLANATFPVTIGGTTFHPQNEALLEWFERQSPSHAIAGAYSYPDTKLLTSLSPSENPGCK